MNKIFSCYYLVTTAFSLFSQEKQKAVTLNGYLTSLQSAMFDSLSGPLLLIIYFITDLILRDI